MITRKLPALRSEAKWLMFCRTKFRSLAGTSSPHPKTISYCACRHRLVIAAGTRGCHKVRILIQFLFLQTKNCCFVSTAIFCFPWWKRGEVFGEQLFIVPFTGVSQTWRRSFPSLPLRNHCLGRKHFSCICGVPQPDPHACVNVSVVQTAVGRAA